MRRLVTARLLALFTALLALTAATPVALAQEPPGTRIVGGQPVPDGTYPFQAALLSQRSGSTDYDRQFCGGTLIAADRVLTAAHCVRGLGLLGLWNLRVVVGRTVLTSTQGQKVNVASLYVHPQYDPRTSANDVAILRLKTPVTGIEPIALVPVGDSALEQPGATATVSGWGNTVPQPPAGGGNVVQPDRMHAASVPLVSDASCAAAYDDGAGGFTFVAETMVCAGQTGLDTCQGDSGGPMFVATGAGFTQIGVTSWGAGCGAQGYPGVYAQLSSPSIGSFIRSAAGLPAGT
jgi:secreted trypsin-like serine protease